MNRSIFFVALLASALSLAVSTTAPAADDPAALEDEIQHRPPPYQGEPTAPFTVAKVAR